mmetsp:Transcript_35700/g.114208  ORF Transcript_35700/g.114208 Transcript_35700/m.114208 type:complete len:253 (+) Transcript_35700:2152-2910(+)
MVHVPRRRPRRSPQLLALGALLRSHDHRAFVEGRRPEALQVLQLRRPDEEPQGTRRPRHLQQAIADRHADLCSRIHGLRRTTPPSAGTYERRLDGLPRRFDLLPAASRHERVALLPRHLAPESHGRPRRRHGLRRPPQHRGLRLPLLRQRADLRHPRLRRHRLHRHHPLPQARPQGLHRRHGQSRRQEATKNAPSSAETRPPRHPQRWGTCRHSRGGGRRRRTRADRRRLSRVRRLRRRRPRTQRRRPRRGN